jgi:hypothetical protein
MEASVVRRKVFLIFLLDLLIPNFNLEERRNIEKTAVVKSIFEKKNCFPYHSSPPDP